MTNSYVKPLAGLIDGWAPKLALAFGAAVLDGLVDLFHQDGQLVLLISILIILDFVTGVVAALQRGERIRSKRLRETGIKIIEVSALLAATTAVANSFEVLSWAGTAAFFFVALTELKSVFENVSEGALKTVVERLLRMMKERGVED